MTISNREDTAGGLIIGGFSFTCSSDLQLERSLLWFVSGEDRGGKVRQSENLNIVKRGVGGKGKQLISFPNVCEARIFRFE